MMNWARSAVFSVLSWSLLQQCSREDIHSLNLGLCRPYKTISGCLVLPKHYSKQRLTPFFYSHSSPGFCMKHPSGICISFTCRWGKMGGVLFSGRGVVWEQSLRKDGWQRFLSPSDKEPFDPERTGQIHAASLQRDIGLQQRIHCLFPLTHSHHRCRHTPTKRPERAHRSYSWTLSEGFATDTGCNGNSVSHSHVLVQRSRFMGGAQRAQWCSVCHHADFQ